MDFKNYFKELKRRNVFKAGLAYLVVGWIILQAVSIVFPMFNISKGASKAVFLVLLIGLPVWLVFAWVYEVTPEGLKKTENINKEHSITGKTSDKFNKLIIGALAIAIILVGANLYYNYSSENPTTTTLKKEAVKNQEKSVAVLAFDDMSQKKDQEYFSDGISEEILNFLAKNPDLKVISRTSSFSYKGKEVRVETIGKELGVNYLLEGSVRKSGSTLRITAQLINTKTGNHLWSQTYDREMDDIFKIQDDIAGEVTKNLEAKILGRKIQAVDPDAYTKYLQAKSLWSQYTPESLGKAKELIDQAIAIDSSYAPIWYTKSKIEYSLSVLRGLEIERKELLEEKKYLDKAIALDPEYADAYAVLGGLYMDLGEPEKEERLIKKALQLEKDNPTAILSLAQSPTVSVNDRLRLIKKVMELDPLYYTYNYYLFGAYLEGGEYQKAIDAMETYLLHYPNASQTYGPYAETLALTGKFEEAIEALKKETDEFQQFYVPPLIYIGMGDKEKALEAIQNFKNKYADLAPYAMAEYYAYLNEKEKAYKWLEKTLKNHPEQLQLYKINYDPYMNNLRGEKHFKEIVKRADLPEVKPLDIELD